MDTSTKIMLLTGDEPHHAQFLESIVNLHASCIINDHTMATFMPPLSYERMLQRWQSFLAETVTGLRVIIVAVSNIAERTESSRRIANPFNTASWPLVSPQEEVSGLVSLSMPRSETGPFRGLVQNLFVSPYHRRKNIASKLMQELEIQALKNRRWNLMLDTIEGTPAVILYKKLGWQSMGIVKDYGINPGDGRLQNEVFFWKDIRPKLNANT